MGGKADEDTILSVIGTVFRIDEEGRIWRIATGRRGEYQLLNGHWQMRYRGSDAYSHRVVYRYFTGKEIPGGYVIHHKNGDGGDNRPENLLMMLAQIHPHGFRAISDVKVPINVDLTGLSDEVGETAFGSAWESLKNVDMVAWRAALAVAKPGQYVAVPCRKLIDSE